MLKKIIAFSVSAALCAGLFSGCSSANNGASAAETSADSNNLSVVCTIFPQYDWTKQIIGETVGADLTLLLDNGTDLHNYQPTADDIVKISDCDLFIYVGGESDGWVDEVLSNAVNKEMQVINLMNVMGDKAKEEEIVEGMQAEEEDEHEHAEEAPEFDEHVWLSLKNAELFCSSITNALCAIDSANSAAYKANCEKYTGELKSLDEKYQSMVSSAKNNTVLFGDRFPFRYLTDDYGIEYYAAFVGCSAETEASFETIIFLSDKVNELSLPAVFKLEGSDGKIAETVVSNTSEKNQKVLTLDSMQSVTLDNIADGETYLKAMNENYEALKEALN